MILGNLHKIFKNYFEITIKFLREINFLRNSMKEIDYFFSFVFYIAYPAISFHISYNQNCIVFIFTIICDLLIKYEL